MANRVFLYRCDFPDIYPAHDNPAFNEEDDTVAEGVYQIPLLWMALFRIGDVHTRILKSADTGEDVEVEAPLADADRSLKQFEGALPLYRSLFPELGSLAEDASRLVAAIRSFRGQFLSLGCYELEVMDDPSLFRTIARRQLEFLTSPNKGVLPVRSRAFERFRRPRSQQKLQRELLAVHSELRGEDRKGFVPDLIGESWLKGENNRAASNDRVGEYSVRVDHQNRRRLL